MMTVFTGLWPIFYSIVVICLTVMVCLNAWLKQQTSVILRTESLEACAPTVAELHTILDRAEEINGRSRNTH